MVLVAAAMVAVMAMAALSIDVITLYLANAEAQRAADAGALAAARMLSIYGITGDPLNGSTDWSTACTAATQAAQTVANQNFVAGTVPSTVNVTYPQAGSCSAGGTVFGVNPVVQVQVQRGNLPTFFARIWGRRSATISASGVAEGFNSSGSAAYPAGMVSVQPRCVKPWLVANGTVPNDYVDPTLGTITNPGIQLSYLGNPKIVGSQVTLQTPPGCTGTTCLGVENSSLLQNQYVAASVQGTPVAVASGATTGDSWQQAIAGCDQTTVYACGTVGGATADLTTNLGAPPNNDTYNATEALTNASGGGADSIVTTAYPFQIRAGLGNPLVSNGIVNDDDVITSSNSIVTIPLIDNTLPFPNKIPQPSVTVVGFLQMFITQVQLNGTIQGTVLNVAGCGNGTPPTSVTGSSPVPVRLINYP
jgi:hypothetical protein